MLSQRKANLLWRIRETDQIFIGGKMEERLLKGTNKHQCQQSKEFDDDYSTVSNLCQLFFTNLCNPTSPAEVIELIKTFTHINIYISLVRVSDLTTRALLQFSAT